MLYYKVSDFVTKARLALQDEIAPYRYPDDQIVDALNVAMFEVSRLREDIFLDLKYQQPLQRGDLGNGIPDLFLVTRQTDMVPIPSNYISAIQWFIAGWLQFYDVTDSQDQRAQGFMAKFQSHLMSLASA